MGICGNLLRGQHTRRFHRGTELARGCLPQAGFERQVPCPPGWQTAIEYRHAAVPEPAEQPPGAGSDRAARIVIGHDPCPLIDPESGEDLGFFGYYPGAYPYRWIFNIQYMQSWYGDYDGLRRGGLS